MTILLPGGDWLIMTFPYRISVLTYNLWNTQRWPERQAAVEQFFHIYQPDIFGLQELRAETRLALDVALPGYQRVQDDFPGWERESNLYWNGSLLEETAHGFEDIAIHSDPYRGLFWVRLLLRGTQRTLLVSTAHYTYSTHPKEVESGQSPRVEQSLRTIEALERLGQPGEPVFFMGDLNDAALPMVLFRKAGFHSCFAPLALLPPPTWPSLPTADMPALDEFSNQTIDWIFSNDRARPLAALVPQYFHKTITPSDHWPVLSLYELAG
jgi:endonuclease/exonuclease/phosphatase family metal-dependent hydrolase